jgi:hypothetical protein
VSAYGTFDQGGNVAEWGENIKNVTDRILLGGQRDSNPSGEALAAMNQTSDTSNPTSESNDFGFRVASIAELFAPEDLNIDGFVDGLDLGILLGNWRQFVPPSGGELDARPPVDGEDLGILLGAWNPQPLVAASTVPEPNTLLLGALTTMGLLLRRW